MSIVIKNNTDQQFDFQTTPLIASGTLYPHKSITLDGIINFSYGSEFPNTKTQLRGSFNVKEDYEYMINGITERPF